MPIPTFKDQLGQSLLGPNVTVIQGAGLFGGKFADEDLSKLSIEDINKELATEAEGIEFFAEEPIMDEPYQHYLKVTKENAV